MEAENLPSGMKPPRSCYFCKKPLRFEQFKKCSDGGYEMTGRVNGNKVDLICAECFEGRAKGDSDEP